MTQTSEPSPVSATGAVTRGMSLLHVWTLLALAVLLLAGMQRAYILACHFDFLRIDCIAGGIAGGIGMAACLGGAMYFLDLAIPGTGWFWKFLLVIQKRLLMIAQIVVMGVCVYAAGLMVFHKRIPGSETWLHNPINASMNAGF